ncbi:subtilisin-like serine protease [Tulasnella sp. UAMH 9824]|nr:subtilisin-like serine protease [Tulasnella sp. UAMH 9824]
MFASFALSLLTSILVRGVQAAPTNIPSNVQPIQGPINHDSYIVKVLDTADKAVVIDNLQRNLNTLFTLVHNYDSEFFNAFSAIVDPSALNTVASDPNIEYISEDGILRTTATQSTAPWGLQRISHKGALPANSNPKSLTYTYDYSPSAGQGVNVYIVDTGINTNHVNFDGRASFGYSAVGATEDGNGHGTHCAGTAVGSLYGVARSARVIAVKVLSDEGTGSTSNIIAGIDWVVGQYRQNGVPAVMSMSLGGAPNVPLDRAVDNVCVFHPGAVLKRKHEMVADTGSSLQAVKAGVHVTVAAGNDGRDAALTSPAHVPSVITVGATTIADVRASFSNYGALVDIYAPGQNVTSSWIGSAKVTKNISGTSMATPHVAGVLACLISQHGNLPPDQLRNLLLSSADHTKSGLPIAQVPAAPRTAIDISGATDGATNSEAEVAETTE